MKIKLIGTVLASLVMAGCGNTLERLSRVGGEPDLAPIQNPTQQANYHPVSLPMPEAMPDARQPNSLWRQGSRAFFEDQRAGRVGDILTVVIHINDQATLDNKTSRSHSANEAAALDSLLGYETKIDNIFNKNADPGSLVDGSAKSNTEADGSVAREEDIDLRVAAVITQVLPNGNLAIQGSQQVRVNAEMRELTVVGVIRPEDITSLNEVPYDKIAEARIAYGGRGTISDIQGPKYGQELLDILFPF